MFTCEDMTALLASNTKSDLDLKKKIQEYLDKNAGISKEEVYSLFPKGDTLPWDISNKKAYDSLMGYKNFYAIDTVIILQKPWGHGADDCIVVSNIKDGGINELWISCEQDKNKNKKIKMEFKIQLMPKTGNKHYEMTKRFNKSDLKDFNELKDEINKCIDEWNNEIGPEYLKRYTEEYEDWSGPDRETMAKLADDFYYTNNRLSNR